MRLLRPLFNVVSPEAAPGATAAAPAAAAGAGAGAAPAAAEGAPAAPATTEKVEAKDEKDPKEPAAEEKKVEEKKVEEDPKFGPKFRALAKRDLALKNRESAVAAQEQKYAAFETFDTLMKSDPTAALKVLGIEDEALNAWLMKLAKQRNGKASKPTVEDDVREMKEREAARDRAAAEQRKRTADAEREQTAASIREKITTVIDGKKADDFEMLSMVGDDGVEAVFQLMDLTYKKSGVILPVDQACAKAEAFLVDEARELAAARKLKLVPASDATRQPAPATANGQHPSPTLTSAHTSSTAAAQSGSATEGHFEKTERLAKTLFKKT